MNISRHKLYDIIRFRLQKYCSSHTIGFDLSVALKLLALIIFNDPVKGCYRKGTVSDWDRLPESKSLFYAPSGCGLPIGNLTSQLFSNNYLSGFDGYVKRTLKFRHYGRYVDDFFIVSQSKSELMASVPMIRNYLYSELGLRLHPRKVHLTSIHHGVRFLGAVVKPYQRYMTPRASQHLRDHINNVLVDETDPFRIRSILQSYNGYMTHFSHPLRLTAQSQHRF